MQPGLGSVQRSTRGGSARLQSRNKEFRVRICCVSTRILDESGELRFFFGRKFDCFGTLYFPDAIYSDRDAEGTQ